MTDREQLNAALQDNDALHWDLEAAKRENADLLAALTRLVGTLSELPAGVEMPPDDGSNVWDAARAAILKATGGAP